jgi:hypothetical protein
MLFSPLFLVHQVDVHFTKKNLDQNRITSNLTFTCPSLAVAHRQNQ